MFGLSSQEIMQGAMQPTGELPQSDKTSSFGDVASATFADRYSTGDFGRESLIDQGLNERNQALHAQGLIDDPSVYGSRPQYADAIEGKPSNDIMAATYWREVQAQKKQEDQIDQIRQNNPQLIIPSYRDIVNEAAAKANSLDMQAEDTSRHAGTFARIGGSLAGGIAATFTPENALQASTMLLPIPGTGTARIGSMALQQFGVSLATQAAVVNPSRKAMGLSTMTTPDMLENALLQGAVGGVAEGALQGAHAGMRYIFPGTTATAAQPVSAALDRMAEAVDTPEAQLAKGLINAKTPDEAAATMSAAPLETQLDVAHAAAGDNASTGERAILQAGEQELLNEKAQPDGMDWPQHVQNLQAAAQAIEAGQPVPEFTAAQQPGVKYPVQQWLRQQGGVEVGSALDGEMRNMGINPKTAPGLFKAEGRGGLADVDNIPLTEWKMSAAKADDTGSYVDRQYVLDALAAERGGRPVTNEGRVPEHGSIIPGSEDDLRQYAHSLGLDTEGSTPQRVLEMVKAEEMKQQRVAAAPPAPLPETTPRVKQREAQLQQRYKEIDATVSNAEKYLNSPVKKMQAAWEGKDYGKVKTDISENDSRIVVNHMEVKAGNAPEKYGEKIMGELTKYADDTGKRIELIARPDFAASPIGRFKDFYKKFGFVENSGANRDSATKAAMYREPVKAEGKQTVIPGAERIPDRELAERKMQEPMKGGKEQKSPDEGLFDTGARQQEEMFKDLDPKDAAPVSDDKAMTVQAAVEEIRDHEALMQAMTTCFKE